MKTTVFLTLLSLVLSPLCPSAAAESSRFEIGVRGGGDVSKRNLDENYETAEVYLFKQLPWCTSVGEQVSLTSRFDFGAAYLESGDDEGAILAAGADLVLGLWNGRLEFDVGFRPTWMLNHDYGDDDFGGGMQFTSHAGLAASWHQVVLNYRVQHTSNAGIYEHNPGLNLHMVGLGYRF